MPRLSVWMVRAALLHLGIGFLFGGLMLFNKGVPYAGVMWRLLLIHLELLMFGWIFQLAIGVAFWIVPRFATPPRYGRVWLAALTFILLNAGVWINAAGQWFNNAVMQFGGHVLILLAGVSFILHIFPRIKPIAFATGGSDSLN